MFLLDAARRSIRRYEMVPAGGRVVVALSGGPDSVALLHLLRDLERDGDLVVAGVAHFNHQLRAAADDDEQFCRDLAASLALPIDVERADVKGVARAEKRSIEDAARRLRYGFLERAADRLTAAAIAVGHSLDDQAETFLLRLLRGAGTRGLAAIRPRAGRIIRPLIEIRRAELRAFAATRGIPFREDESNADVSIPRNRIRHALLPYLEREFTANVVEVLAREAELARQDEERLEMEAIDLAASIVLTNTRSTSEGRPGTPAAGRRVSVDAAELSALHPALASRVARVALAPLAVDRFVGFEHVQAFLDFVHAGRPGSALSLPGQQAVHHGGRVDLGPEPGRTPVSGEAGNSLGIPLSIPGEVVLPAQGWLVSAAWAGSGPPPAPDVLVAQVSGLTAPLLVRTRRPGDRFRPPGLGGKARKLQDFLVDRKVPRGERDRLPLVVDGDDQIVWIVGHAVAEGFRAAAPSPGVILLIARHLGGEV